MEQGEKRELMLIGTKESFLIRALEKKLTEAGIAMFFVTADVDAINRGMERASVLAYYLETGEAVKADVLHYLNEQLIEANKRIILIGEKNDTDPFLNHIHGDQILKVFPRPLVTEEFIETVLGEMSDESVESRKKSVLIVDDDPTYIGVIREWLRGSYRVSMANSGLQAITWLATNHVDLVLLDHEMPVTSGPKVLEMMRSEPATSSIPVIFLTGKSDRASVMEAVEQKPEGYLLKTIDRETLLGELSKFFQSRG